MCWLCVSLFACGDVEGAARDVRDAAAPIVPEPDPRDAGEPAPEVDAAPPLVPSAPPPPSDEVPPPDDVVARKNLYIVAHQDDDLGVMSPDLINRVRSGEPVRTVYMTSGDAGLDCPDYVADREEGVKQAYARMAGVDSDWDAREVLVLGKTLRLLKLRGTHVSLMFFGLHNSGYNLDFKPDLETLWSGERPVIDSRPFDGRSRTDAYTRSELIAVLRQLMYEFGPTHVYTLDSSRLQPLFWPFDHSDHVHSALFALAALLQYDRPHSTGMYRTYNDRFEHANVSAKATAEKKEIFQLYLSHDPKICDTGTVTLCGAEASCDLPAFYQGYEDRQYRTAVYENVSGLLRAPGGTCVIGEAQGEALTVAPCDASDPRQLWKVSLDGSIRHVRSALCMDANASTRGAQVALEPCQSSLRQRFLLTTQTQLRGPDATCVQLDAGVLSLRECALDPRQMDWEPGLYPNFVTGLIEDLTNWEIPDWISYYGSLSYGDVDGDGDDDLCVRRGDGVYCAFASSAGFTGFSRALDGFRDDQGWFVPAYGATVQLGDIDGDGAAELCGRGPDGVYCADFVAGEGRFDLPTLRSRDFGDDQFYDLAASRYRSLRIVDLDGDGSGDLCARNDRGIACARSLRGARYEPARMWTEDEFGDGRGWGSDQYGTTLRYGDVDGDGDADVCGRNREGIVCARNAGGRFVDPHTWSHTGDFGDASGWAKQLSYYGTIRLIDVDHNGTSDVCGRGPDGLLCSLSTGVAFTVATVLGSAQAFSDANGWIKDRYGATLGLLDLNLDGSPDLCAWGPGQDGQIGLNCSLAQ